MPWCSTTALHRQAVRRGLHSLTMLQQVHSTLAAGLLPAGDVASIDDVYAWLRGLLEVVWRDPVCGDGVCESPFEYAQYGECRPCACWTVYQPQLVPAWHPACPPASARRPVWLPRRLRPAAGHPEPDGNSN